MDEEVAPLDDGHSDDDILANSSDEEDDSSSVSSKGEAERPEDSRVRRPINPSFLLLHFWSCFVLFFCQMQERQKSKIRHIATEIMTSEAV